LSKKKYYDFLCQAISSPLDRSELSELNFDDWQNISELASEEGVAPLLWWRLNEQGYSSLLPQEAAKYLQSVYYDCVSTNTLLESEVSKIGAYFCEKKIPVILLKGAALSRSIYPDPGLRPMNDLDLLVRKQNLPQAVKAITALGYEEQKTTYHVLFFGGPGKRVTLELHWNLQPSGHDSLSEDNSVWAWEDSVPFDNSLMLSPEATLLYLSAHLTMQHGETTPRLIWFYDLHLLILKYNSELDWTKVLGLSRKLGWETALAEALLGSLHFFATEMPVEVLTSLYTIIQKGDQIKANFFPRWMLASLMSLGWKARLRITWSLIFPAPAYMRWRYQPDPEWLWPVMYPLRWVELVQSSLNSLLNHND
jgi:hypothetical protein